MTEKRYDVIDKEEPRGQSVTFGGIPCTARHCCTVLNRLTEENEQLKFENNELKCALALDEVEYIIADGKKIDIPPYYEFEQRYDSVMHRREYDGYD